MPRTDITKPPRTLGEGASPAKYKVVTMVISNDGRMVAQKTLAEGTDKATMVKHWEQIPGIRVDLPPS